jgi:phosphonate ABC transporter permease subunit PhnE
MKKDKKPLKRFISVALSIILVIIVYAYGFTVTKVNLAETKSQQRQTQLVRIIRALAKPDIIEYEKTEVVVNIPIFVPCPAKTEEGQTIDKSGPYMELNVDCANEQDTIRVRGYNFAPLVEGPLSFVPPSGVNLTLGKFATDGLGYFEVEAKLPKGRESEEAQFIRAITRVNVGSPKFSAAAIETWDKIIETVFLALLATTLGTLLAVPLSFFAARNLMEDLQSPVIGVAIGILIMPIGFLLGAYGANLANTLSGLIIRLPILIAVVLLLAPYLIYRLLKWSLPQVELQQPSMTTRVLRIIALTFSAFATILSLFLISYVAIQFGTWIRNGASFLAFLGKFIADLGEILNMVIVVLAAIGGLGVFNSMAGKLGRILNKKITQPTLGSMTFILLIAAGALLAIIIGAGIDWLYQIENPLVIFYYPAIAGAIFGLIVAVITRKTGILPIGIIIYYVTRTIFNALRSIEALIMAIIFVVWVGIGPFAGALALSLHTIAALAKLYSEQVESILEGPIEAVKASGANQLQTIIYAVVPQIIPPYISFTMYRWDINVRMSTIIGFAGGGGIGFLLQQNINLLNYRGASVQMLAIAIVVASMDYISSRLREHAI